MEGTAIDVNQLLSTNLDSNLPGMIELPGSFSGRDSSPNPHRGPDARNLKSLAIFIIEHAKTFNAPET